MPICTCDPITRCPRSSESETQQNLGFRPMFWCLQPGAPLNGEWKHLVNSEHVQKKMCRMFNAKAPSGQWQNFAWNSQFLLNFGRGCGSWFSWVPFGQMFPCSGLRGFLMIFLSELKTLDDFKSQDCLHMTRCWSKHVKAPQPYFYCVCSWGWIQQLLLSVLQIEHNQVGLPPEAHECVQTCSTRSAS